MHVATLLSAAMFDIEIEQRPANISELFPGWNELDRFGLVIDQEFGGMGATHLLQVAMMAFYDVKPSRRSSHAVYPEIYAFHVGRGYGSHAPYDFWPARREVILETTDHREILDAINDRGITRLAVPNRPLRHVVHRPKEEETAADRIASAFLYSPGGRTADADIRIMGNDKRTEHNPRATLRPVRADSPREPVSQRPGARPVKEADPAYNLWLQERAGDVTDADRDRARSAREAIQTAGLATEEYRRVGVEEALQRLASAGVRQPS